MNTTSEKRYRHHLERVARQWTAALEATQFDAALVAAGAPRNYLFDDEAPPFRPNPHFALWFPDGRCEQALLLFAPRRRPRLFFFAPRDYWHLPQRPPSWAGACFNLEVFSDLAALRRAAAAAAVKLGKVACIGEDPTFADRPLNPSALVDHLHYLRGCKTEFEVDCIAQATRIAVAGHLAAHDAFHSGASERELLGAYLAASGQTESELPYPCILAQNEHAAVLHYRHYDSAPPKPRCSFLIDAGASHHGYAADISRTYPARGGDCFASLINALDTEQRAIIDRIQPGLEYLELHIETHRRLCALLVAFDLVRCSAEAAFELGISRAFLPHGLGHLLGLQVHDVGGQQINCAGDRLPPPDAYPSLRLTRRVETGMVFTIEPGLYFIPMLLEKLRDADAGDEVNWSLVERLLPFGGIRIEDNILVTATGSRNFTREAFAVQCP